MTVYKGRRKITTEYKSSDVVSVEVLSNILNGAMPIHSLNKTEIDYLTNYVKGVQPILNKEKEVRPEINNTLVVNHAEMISRTIVGYFLGTPIQYVQAGDTDKKSQIDELNKYVAYEDKSITDHELGQFQSICGTAYRIIYTDGVLGDEVPFEDKALDPANTFVVYENTIAEKPVVGVTYLNLLDEKGNIKGMKFYAYTDVGMYTIVTNNSTGIIDNKAEVTFDKYYVGGVPIVEYPNNMWRIGDWELALSLMDSINSLQSGRLDDIDQMIQSLIVFINADIDTDRYEEMRDAGVVVLKSREGTKSSIDMISNPLAQEGIAIFSEELESLLYAMIGIPDRKSRSGGGGDTGQAVELRDGWADLEIVARNKEVTFKKAEKQTLKLILNIMKNKLGFDLKVIDIDIKFTRNKNNNLLVKTQSYATLLATKTLSPADCLSIVDLVSDVNEYISRGESFWGELFANKNENNVNEPNEVITTVEED